MIRFLVGLCVMVLAGSSAMAQDTLLTLKAPVGGITYYTTRDTIVQITWGGVDDTIAVRLDYTSNEGRSWQPIADSAKGLSYPWNITALKPGNTYRVRVSQLRPPGAADQVVYTGHRGPVADAWWNPANTRVVSVAAEAHIWDANVSSNQPLQNLPTGRYEYYTVRWSADSTTIVTGSDKNTAEVVDVATNTIAASLAHGDWVTKVELDPTGSWLFTKCDDNKVRVYNIPNTTIRATHNAGSALLDIALNGDGTRVVLSADEARIHGRAGGFPLAFRRHLNGVISAAFSPDGSRVCSIGGDASIRMWNASTGVEIWNASDAKQGVRSVAFSPDGSLVAVGMSDSTVTVWRADGGQRTHTFTGYGGAVRMVNFSPDGSMVAGASDDDFARVHDLARSTTIANFQHGNDVRLARWSNAGDRILTASRDATARIWQVTPIVLQADTSGQFSVAPPPPSFVRFVASGDTLEIEQKTTITIRTEGSQFLGLADIDSVRLRLAYDPSMLFRTTSSVPFASILDANISDSNGINRSVQYLICTVPLDSVDKELMTITFQATLGQDSISSIRFDRIEQIGSGPGARIETRSDPILVRGICRQGEGPRLYNSLGGPLSIATRPAIDGVRVICILAETAPATLNVYDLSGRLVWSDRTSAAEESSRRMERLIPSSILSGVACATLSTSLQTVSTLLMEGGNP